MSNKENMTPEEFCMWLKGFLTAIQSTKQMGEEEVHMILEALNDVKKTVKFNFDFGDVGKAKKDDNPVWVAPPNPQITWSTDKVEVKPDKHTIVCEKAAEDIFGEIR